MDIDKKNRADLKEYFRATKKPTEKQFSEFIDANINQADDGVAKPAGDALSIEAYGDAAGRQDVLHLYSDFNLETPSWSINLNPLANPTDLESNQNGFNIKDATGKSSLFIKSGEGNVGIGTIEPTAPLTVLGNIASGLPETPIKIAADSIVFGGQDNSKNDDSAKLEVDNESFKLYGKATAAGTNRKMDVFAEGGLHVTGSVSIQGDIQADNVATNTDLGGDAASDQNLPSQKAVKEYIDTRLPTGMITMWSGQVAPEGWVICDGENGTPNLSGQFIVGFDGNNTDYNEVGKKGGEERVSLKTEELPAHTHLDKGHIHGVKDDGHNHNHGSFNILLKKSKSGEDVTPNGFDKGNAGTELNIRHSGTIQKSQTGISVTTDYANLAPTGDNQPHENRPPYYVLAYIMKL